jgi:hypothetical protein
LLDAGGKSLGDKNHNGRRDLGPVQPFGGTAVLTLAVTVARNARLGSQDTAVIDIQSFVADSVRDSVRVITEACGAVTALAVEPDQTGAVALGQTEDFRLWVQTAGNVDGIVNVTAASSLSGWESKLYHDDATRELADSDFDGLPDLGLVSPGTRANFVLRITAPAVGDLTGDIDSLLTTWVKVVATLSGEAAISDSAVVRVTAVPRFEVHNTANPFSDRTRFMLSIPRPGRVTLTVYSRLGEVVRSLIDDQPYPTGVYSLEWDGTNSAGRKLAPGIYVYMLELTPATGSPQRTVKKAVIKR